MAIRKREFQHEPEAQEDEDNVIKIDRADDERGVFDPGQDPFPDSIMDRMGVPKEFSRTTHQRILYTNPDIVPTPKQMRVQDLLEAVRQPNNPRDHIEQSYRDRVRSPLTAIRAFCVDNQGGSPRAVANCDVVECPFWPFRMGNNSFRNRGG